MSTDRSTDDAKTISLQFHWGIIRKKSGSKSLVRMSTKDDRQMDHIGQMDRQAKNSALSTFVSPSLQSDCMTALCKDQKLDICQNP